MRAAGRVLSRDALMEKLYNRKATPFDRSIDMHISHLRKKLEHDRTLIKTIRGVGYQFCRTADEGKRMRSLFAKILLWFWATLVITVIGSALISALSIGVSDRRFPLARLVVVRAAGGARMPTKPAGAKGWPRSCSGCTRVYRGDALLHRPERARPAHRRGPLRPGAPRPAAANLRRPPARRRHADARRRRRPLLVLRHDPPRAAGRLVPAARNTGGRWPSGSCCATGWRSISPRPSAHCERAVERFGRGDLSARVEFAAARRAGAARRAPSTEWPSASRTC